MRSIHIGRGQPMSCPLDRAPNLHWRHRYRNFSHAKWREGVENSVHDRRSGADRGAFADAPDAKGIQFGWNFHVTRLKRG